MIHSKAEILDYVKAFADRAHGEQVRKYSGDRYIVHPVRVMKTAAAYNDDVSVLAAALLHDVLEDTPVTAAELDQALLTVMNPAQAKKALELVVALTDVFVKASFPGMNRSARKHKEAQRLSAVSASAQTIKYADLLDNVIDIVDHDVHFAKIFVREAKDLLDVMRDGDPRLRERVLAIVNESLANLKSGVDAR